MSPRRSDQSPPLPDYPFDGKRFNVVPGVAMHYLDEGPGVHGDDGDDRESTVVMVHGNPTWSFYYRHVVLALRDHRRCIVPDHVGMGLSDKPAGKPFDAHVPTHRATDAASYDYSLAQRIDDLDALLMHANVTGKVTLIVHDWGGMIGMGWAVRNAERIDRIAVLNTAAFHLPSTKPMPWQLKLSRSSMGAAMVRGLNGFCRYANKHCAIEPLHRDVATAYLAPHNNWANRVAVHRFVQDIPLNPSHRTWDLVGEIDDALPRLAHVPMTIAWGMKDFVFDQHFLRGWESRFPDASVRRFADAGHYVLEDARREVVDLLADFVLKP